MSKPEQAINTWFRDSAEEAAMEPDHAYLWQHFIQVADLPDMRAARVLDFGCNRGGFLRALYQRHPFAAALGLDIAADSLTAARQQAAGLPITFASPEALAAEQGRIDYAFSHEVLYLLPDLKAHAATIAAALKPGGIYYAAIGCHTGNPLWQDWRARIARTTAIPVFDYSLDDCAAALWHAGFDVAMRSFALDDFIMMKPANPYFPSVADSLDYHGRVKTIIRARKQCALLQTT